MHLAHQLMSIDMYHINMRNQTCLIDVIHFDITKTNIESTRQQLVKIDADENNRPSHILSITYESAQTMSLDSSNTINSLYRNSYFLLRQRQGLCRTLSPGAASAYDLFNDASISKILWFDACFV